MHANDAGTRLHRDERRGHARDQALLDRTAGDVTKRRFARPSHEQWMHRIQQFALPARQLHVVFEALAETDARVEHDALARNAPVLIECEGFLISIISLGIGPVQPEPQSHVFLGGKAPDLVTAEIILTNVRVLAIDQAPKEKDGTNTLVGKTVTLELKPEQAETLARARQSGTLSLALRSIVDVKTVEVKADETKRGEGVNVVRYGIASQQLMQK